MSNQLNYNSSSRLDQQQQPNFPSRLGQSSSSSGGGVHLPSVNSNSSRGYPPQPMMFPPPVGHQQGGPLLQQQHPSIPRANGGSLHPRPTAPSGQQQHPMVSLHQQPPQQFATFAPVPDLMMGGGNNGCWVGGGGGDSTSSTAGSATSLGMTSTSTGHPSVVSFQNSTDATSSLGAKGGVAHQHQPPSVSSPPKRGGGGESARPNYHQPQQRARQQDHHSSTILNPAIPGAEGGASHPQAPPLGSFSVEGGGGVNGGTSNPLEYSGQQGSSAGTTTTASSSFLSSNGGGSSNNGGMMSSFLIPQQQQQYAGGSGGIMNMSAPGAPHPYDPMSANTSLNSAATSGQGSNMSLNSLGPVAAWSAMTTGGGASPPREGSGNSASHFGAGYSHQSHSASQQHVVRASPQPPRDQLIHQLCEDCAAALAEDMRCDYLSSEPASKEELQQMVDEEQRLLGGESGEMYLDEECSWGVFVTENYTMAKTQSMPTYLARLVRKMHADESCLVIAAVLLKRYLANTPECPYTPRVFHRLVHGCYLIAVKIHEEKFYRMTYYAKAGGSPDKEDLCDIELQVYLGLRMECLVKPDEFKAFVSKMRSHRMATSELLKALETPEALRTGGGSSASAPRPVPPSTSSGRPSNTPARPTSAKTSAPSPPATTNSASTPPRPSGSAGLNRSYKRSSIVGGGVSSEQPPSSAPTPTPPPTSGVQSSSPQMSQVPPFPQPSPPPSTAGWESLLPKI